MATFKSLFVLVVDDNPFDAERVCGWLNKQGLSSAHVDSTDKAQAMLRERKPVCVLLDLCIPGSDTFAFLETLYNHKIPTVIFTGNGDERKAVETLKRGAIDYLIKDDLTEDILVDALRHALTRFREKVRLDFLAHYDSLTGLVNRETFTSRLTHAAKRCRRQSAHCTVMYLDIDRFKSYNDAFGHAFGDQVLQRFANRLLRCVRDEDTVARLGGDEFAVLLENSNEELVEEISQRILSGINRPITICEQTVEIGSSIGAATFPETSDNLGEIVTLADEALYFAKMNGRGILVKATPAMRRSAQHRHELMTDLRRDLESDRMFLVFQPLYDAKGHALNEVETLCRWQHPLFGMLAPRDFMSLLEEAGLDGRFGTMVLHKALRLARDILKAGHFISINLCRSQTLQISTATEIETAIKEYDIPTTALRVEIAHSFVNANPELTRRLLKLLDRLDIPTTLDQFRPSRASLGELADMPFRDVKLDRDIVQRLPHDQSTRRYVRAFTGACSNLNIRPIAVGVESEEELNVLAGEGVRAYQGFFFGAPVKLM